MAGIHGRSNDGAYSLVLAGGYEDDVVSGGPAWALHGGQGAMEQDGQEWAPFWNLLSCGASVLWRLSPTLSLSSPCSVTYFLCQFARPSGGPVREGGCQSGHCGAWLMSPVAVSTTSPHSASGLGNRGLCLAVTRRVDTASLCVSTRCCWGSGAFWLGVRGAHCLSSFCSQASGVSAPERTLWPPSLP